MTSADEYRIQAAGPRGASTRRKACNVRKELLQLSKLYLRLAEQADKNSRLDVTYEPPFRTSSPAP
jgi:hypothetical protein